MAILIETRLNALKLNESVQVRKGCLGRIEGICADFKNPTRNGRLYPKELWVKVFNEPLIQEALKSFTLFGELDHPEERFEVLAKEACVVMVDYRIDDEGGYVWGAFDILDTPSGRILKSLLDYGCVMGVSSRGQGDTINDTVDTDTYDFACFDVVSTPAVEKARQSVVENVNVKKLTDLKESLTCQINESNNVSELETIKRVVESTNLPDMQEIISCIEDRSKSLCEGQTMSSNVVKDLQEAVAKIHELQGQLNTKTVKTIEGIDVKELCNTVKTLRKEVLAQRKSNSQLIRENTRIRDELQKVKDNDTVNETKIREAYQTSDGVKHQLQESQSTIRGLRSQLDATQNEIVKLTEQLESANRKVSSLQTRAHRLTESSKLSETTAKQYDGKIQQLTEQVRVLNEDIATTKKNLNEKLVRYSNRLKLFQENYISSQAKILGIDSEDAISCIKGFSTPTSIDAKLQQMRESIDRYQKLPFADGPIVGTVVLTEDIKSPEDEELESSEKFIVSAQKNF